MRPVGQIAYRAYDWLRGGPRKRAKRLLLEHLSREQALQFWRYGYFDVIGGTTHTRYRIHQRIAVNVEAMHNGRVVKCLCFAPTGGLPWGDVLLAQKLALEHAEPEVLAVANMHHPILIQRQW